MNDHSKRIIEIMHEKKMNATQFSEAIGIQRAAMSHITLGRNNPSADVITKIIDRFNDINPGWLLTGRGTMKNIPENQENMAKEQLTHRSQPQEVGKIKNLFQADTSIGNKNAATESLSRTEADKHRTQTSAGRFIFTEAIQKDKILQPENVEISENSSKTTEKEVIIYKETPQKTIEKLVIFFSDHTYETFIQEKRDYGKT